MCRWLSPRKGAFSLENKEPEKVRQALDARDETIRDEANSLKMMLDVTSLLSSNWDVPRVFPAISARIRRVLQQELASFALPTPPLDH